MKIIEKLSTYAALIGVIGALGAQRFATGKLVKGYKKIAQAKKDVKLTADEGAKILGQIETETRIQPNEVFIDRNGVKVKNVVFDKRSTTKSEKKTELVKPRWYEGKWLYFTYGAGLSFGITTLVYTIIK